MNEIQVMNLNEREKKYFDYLESLNLKEFYIVIRRDYEKICQELRKPREPEANYSGIFRKTHGRVKCASGVKYGL